LQIACEVFRDCCKAVKPVATIGVNKALIFVKGGDVKVSTNNAVDVCDLCQLDETPFVRRRRTNDPTCSAQGPRQEFAVPQAQKHKASPELAIKEPHTLIQDGAYPRHECRPEESVILTIAVHNQQLATVAHCVKDALLDRHLQTQFDQRLLRSRVVVAPQIYQFGALLDAPAQMVDHSLAIVRPANRYRVPEIKEVADQVISLRPITFEEICQKLRLRHCSAKVTV